MHSFFLQQFLIGSAENTFRVRCVLLPHHLFVSPLIMIMGRGDRFFLLPGSISLINSYKSLITHATLSPLITVRSLQNEGGAASVFSLMHCVKEKKKSHAGWRGFGRALWKAAPHWMICSACLPWNGGRDLRWIWMRWMKEAMQKLLLESSRLLEQSMLLSLTCSRKRVGCFISDCNVYIGSHFGQAVAWTAVQGKWSFHHSN